MSTKDNSTVNKNDNSKVMPRDDSGYQSKFKIKPNKSSLAKKNSRSNKDKSGSLYHTMKERVNIILKGGDIMSSLQSSNMDEASNNMKFYFDRFDKVIGEFNKARGSKDDIHSVDVASHLRKLKALIKDFERSL